MSTIFARKFIRDASERAVKTIAQTAAALLGVNALSPLDVDWVQIAAVAGLAGLVSLLTSVGSGYVGDDSPSLVE